MIKKMLFVLILALQAAALCSAEIPLPTCLPCGK